jgi:hypothetical protein
MFEDLFVTARAKALHFAKATERSSSNFQITPPCISAKKSETMADDLSKHGPRDRDRINVHEEREAHCWSKKFGLTKEKLQEAVQKSG